MSTSFFYKNIHHVGKNLHILWFLFGVNFFFTHKIGNKGKMLMYSKKLGNCRHLQDHSLPVITYVHTISQFFLIHLNISFISNCMYEKELSPNENHKMCKFLPTCWIFL
jgi:hypothetical protein